MPEDILAAWTERDLTANLATLPPAFEIDEIVAELSDHVRQGRHPVVCGMSGVGKTSAIFELLRRANPPGADSPLAGKRVLQLSIHARVSALRDPRDLGSYFSDMIDALVEARHEVVPYIRDLHLAWAFGVGPQISALAYRLRCAILAEGSRSGIEQMFDAYPELWQSYAVVKLEEPQPEQVAAMLTAWNERRRSQARRPFTAEALSEALHLSHRFLARGHLPRKAFDLLRQAEPPDATAEAAAEPISAGTVIERFCRNYRIPRVLADPETPLAIEPLEQRLTSRVLGQPEAVRAVIETISAIKAGLTDVRRPLGAFLFVGPTGVGKTHVASLLAEHLFGSRERLVRLNLADFPEPHDADQLFGNSYDSRIAIQRGLLTTRLEGHPFGVLLLDEFEKAASEVHDRFLQLIDEGWFINAAGESVPCRSFVIIATTNTGAELYRGHSLGFGTAADLAAIDQEVHRRLLDQFRFEFLNRFDRIVYFHPLTREDTRRIAQRELEALEERVGWKQRRYRLEADESVLDWLAVNGYDPNFGARFLRRVIERHVTTALADLIVRAAPQNGAAIQLTVRRNRVVASAPQRAATAERAAVALPVGTTERRKTLDERGLIEEARELVRSAEPRLVALEARRGQATGLLEQMGEPGFWTESGRHLPLLEQYRQLDVAARAEERLAEPIRELGDLLAGEGQDSTRLARTYERAAQALRRWDQWIAEEGPSAVWMVLGRHDPLRDIGDWLTELCAMELAWCRRLQLDAHVLGYEEVNGQLTRVVIDVEGPGAAALLALEAGLHRLARPREGDLRARIDLVPHGNGDFERGPAVLHVAATRQRLGRFELPLAWKARGEGAAGRVIELLGADRAALERCLVDLGTPGALAAEPEEARVYAADGTGAWDPRTQATVARFKDALKGKLDALLEAWRRRAEPEAS